MLLASRPIVHAGPSPIRVTPRYATVLGYEAYQALYRSLLIIHTARYGLIYVSHELRLSCGLDLRAHMMTKHV